MAKKTEVQEILEKRDGMTDAEAEQEYLYAKEEIHNMLENGCSYDEVEEFMMGELGLEMDYIFDIM